MTDQESQVDADFNLYFIVSSKYETEAECNEHMWNAFNKCCESDIIPIWMLENKCSKMQPTKTDVFVFEEFEGDAFKRLKTFKCSIVGPRCLSECFAQGEPIPSKQNPVYTTAMKDICLCVSGLHTEEKIRIQELVEYMGGIFTRQLRGNTTHLVTGSIMSAKYETAVDMKISIVTKEWVYAIWKKNLEKFVKADDKMFNQYKAPVFLELIVTSTNLSRHEKEGIKRLINSNGGIMMGALDARSVKVVLAPENSPMSDKLKFAQRENIPCLVPEWVYDSVKVGCALPFKNYLVKSLHACSSPLNPNEHFSMNCSTVSVIPTNAQQSNYINETALTTMMNVSTLSTPSNNVSTVPTMSDYLDRLSFTEAKTAGPFLDGCCIYLAGFTSHQRDKMNKILNVGSATRLDDISDALTHVIVGDESKAASELKLMKSKGLCPYILSLEWLQESIKLKRPAPEENYLCEQRSILPNVTEAPSPLSKKNLQMLQKPQKVPIPSFDIDRKLATSKKEKEKESELLEQYLLNTVVAKDDETIVAEPFSKSHTPTLEAKRDKTLINNYEKRESCSKQTLKSETSKYSCADDSAVPISQISTLNDRLFEGLTFFVTGFTDEESYSSNIIGTIAAMNGKIVSSKYAGIPDFGVVPKYGAPLKHTVNEIVTDLYIEDCVCQEKIVEIMYYHKPLSIRKNTQPLSGCVITMSMYTGVERQYLVALATELGAMCQDIFVRKTNLEKNTCGSTHLVCPTPEGNKYKAAVKWKLPAVTADWLKLCAAQSKRVHEAPFLVGETIAPELPSETSDTNGSNQTASSVETPVRNIRTPKRHLPNLQSQEGNSSAAPINKRLSSLINRTPQSQFHVSTPDTPYGQVIKPNPSPETRKGWMKWANNFPDIRVEEPPLKKRPLSTPLSELKRQLWKNAKDRICNPQRNGNDATSDDASSEVAKDNSTPTTTATPINRKLEFNEENSPLKKNEINMQIAQLDEMFQRTSNGSNRCSLSGESAKSYSAEPDPIQNFMLESQPVDVMWEDPSSSARSKLHEELNENNEDASLLAHGQEEFDEELEPPKKRRFMLSGLKDRIGYEQAIIKLGGEVSSDTSFDANATHLLCLRPARNEKMLCSIASGKCILHCMYLCDSEQEGRFVDEEKYEWGNPKSKGVIPDPNGEIENTIAAAAYRWRLQLLKDPSGPFKNMVALLFAYEEKYDQFKRLIETGGGTVVQARPPYNTSPTGKKITHCFVNIRQVSEPIDWAMLANKGIMCFMPQYLSDYLTSQTPLRPRECVIPEFKKYLALLPK